MTEVLVYIAEYALQDVAELVGVARYVTRLVESLPPKLRGSLPSPKQIEAGLKDVGTGGEWHITNGDTCVSQT